MKEFFHMAVSLLLFLAAAAVLAAGMRSVTGNTAVLAAQFEDPALYETIRTDIQRIVPGEWVMAVAMDTARQDAFVVVSDGKLLELPKNSDMAVALLAAAMPPDSQYLVSYEYTEDGARTAVVFTGLGNE